MNRLALPLAPAAALLALATLAGCSARAQLSEAQADPAYAFPHSPHLDGDVACLSCHAGIAGAGKLEAGVRHVQMPAHPSQDPACADCHDQDPALTVPARAVPFRVNFDHQAHLAKVKDCKTCHQKPPEPGDAEAKGPPMATCTSCHNHQADYAGARCTPCHVDLKGALPKLAFKHQGDWLKIHGPMARPTAESCSACHDQTYCAECHSSQTAAARPSVIFPEAVTRSFIHRGDFVARHQLEASANPASCRTCHGSAFCSACHVEQGVTAAAVNVRDPHPAGWSTDQGTRHFHGDAAKRDILSCAGCHDNGAAANCVGCHQMGGVGGNPHPRAFVRQHRGEEPSTKSMCKACHTLPMAP